MPKGIPLTEEQLDARRREIADSALELFVSRGFNETSMREIAVAAGVGKSTLYDYFPAKDDILAHLVVVELDVLLERARAIVSRDDPAPVRLRALMRMHLDTLLGKRAFFLQLTQQAQQLGPASVKRIQASRYAYQDLVRDLVAQGVSAGEFRSVSVDMATKALMALMAPVVWTTRPVGTPHEMLDDALDIVLHGLRA